MCACNTWFVIAFCSKLEQEFADSWSLLRGRGSVDCVRVYLTVVRKWSYFGARIFSARVSIELCESVFVEQLFSEISVLSSDLNVAL